MFRILWIPACRAQVVPDVIDASVRPRPENLFPHGDGGVAFAPHARKRRFVREPRLSGRPRPFAERKEFSRYRVHVLRKRTVAVDRIDIEEVLGVFQEVFVYSRASLSVHAGNIPRRGPAVRYHAHAGTAFFQGDVRLALHGNGLVVSACEAEVPLVANLVVVDAFAVPRGEPFAERAKSSGGRRPHRARIPDCVRAGPSGHRPARRLEDYRVERDSVLLELAQKLVRAFELPAVRTIRLDARHVREVCARKFRSAGDKGGRGNAAIAVREPRKVPMDAEPEGPARLFRRDGVEVHDGEASIDGRDASVVRGKFAANFPHALFQVGRFR